MADEINAGVRRPIVGDRQRPRSSGVRPDDRAQQILSYLPGQNRLAGEIARKGTLDNIAASLLVFSGLLYIYFDLFGGIIRMVLPALSLTLLTYLPGEIAVVALLCDIVSRLRGRETAIPIIALLGFLVVEIILSTLVGRQPLAIMFSLYIMLPAFVMVALTRRRMQERLIRAMFPVFFLALIGVLVNIVVKYPWADATFEVLGQTKTAAREWTDRGMPRLAGFSRASTSAAAQILIGFCVVEYRLKYFPLQAILWVLGLIAIHFTTSKSPELAMILLPVTYLAVGRIRQTAGARRTWAANAIMGAWLLLVFAGPFLAMTYGPRIYPLGVGVGKSYNSLADRVLNTWPQAIALFDWRNPVEWLVGRGLGGIGGAQSQFELQNYNSADNMAIYLFVMFGWLAVIILYLIFRGGHRAINGGARGRRDFVMIIAMLGIGAAANVVEHSISAMVLALACARTQSVREKRDA